VNQPDKTEPEEKTMNTNATQTYILFNAVSVGVALLMLGLSIWLAPIDLSTKGHWAMGVLLLTGSLVNLVKYRMDERIAADTTSKVEKARQEKLISEYVGKE
jgi:hypothetical protein